CACGGTSEYDRRLTLRSGGPGDAERALRCRHSRRGNAAMGATVAPREAGLSVAMIENDLLGGTCPNRGCMPKKVLVAAAHALDEIERATKHHITIGKPSLDWAALIDREKAMILGIPASLEELRKRRGVEVIHDRG